MIEKEQTPTMFDDISQHYDLMNDIMTLGHHRAWKNYFVKIIDPKPNEVIADLAAGTGDIAARILKKEPSSQVALVDPSSKMLKLAQKRLASKASYSFSSAEKLPFDDASFDKVVISFGLRNTVKIDTTLVEIHRILKPKGLFFSLEFSKPHKIISPFYRLLKSKLFPQIGALITRNKNAYNYLSESIDAFYDQEALKSLMESNYFENVVYKNLSFGVVAIHQAQKNQ